MAHGISTAQSVVDWDAVDGLVYSADNQVLHARHLKHFQVQSLAIQVRRGRSIEGYLLRCMEGLHREAEQAVLAVLQCAGGVLFVPEKS